MTTLMAYPSRDQLRGDHGFTLIEILVVVFIIGVLAAIAIASLLSQQSKSFDAVAKEVAHNGQTAAETYSTEHEGKYDNLSPEALHEVDITLQTAAGNRDAYLSVAEAKESGRGYVLMAVAAGGGDSFTITRKENGEVSRTCKAGSSNQGGCATGTW